MCVCVYLIETNVLDTVGLLSSPKGIKKHLQFIKICKHRYCNACKKINTFEILFGINGFKI